MSTKIWEAYALRPGFDFYATMMDIKHRATGNVQKVLRSAYANMVNSKESISGEKPPKDAFEASRIVRKLYAAQLGKSEKDAWDLDVSIAIRRSARRGRWLLIPYPGSGILGGTLRFMKRHHALTDYHYQNSTDKSARCSDRAWAARGVTWGRLHDKGWQDMLVLDIVTINGLPYICPAWADMAKQTLAARRKRR